MLLRHHFTRPAFWLDLVAGAAFLLVPAFICWSLILSSMLKKGHHHMDTTDTTLQDFLHDLFAPDAYCPANDADDTTKVDPFTHRAWRPEYAGQEPPF